MSPVMESASEQTAKMALPAQGQSKPAK